ncbi:hypothetical protein [Jeongeupia sp. USM3]|uniref:hypothetical protein n=1 Tax=Jeongeupia sp. USM3 TaxID=1906741 RepID=UPI00089DE352|nr:hypothetical protein [Jeongeupia sp. USM3]AOX99253.1 hypothetical protein BJP62_01565 [Jeongeupia sp. USM3]
MKALVFSGLALAAVATATGSIAAGGTLTFVGQVVESPCSIGHATTYSLVPAPRSALAAPDTLFQTTNVSMEIGHCGARASTAALSLTSINSSLQIRDALGNSVAAGEARRLPVSSERASFHVSRIPAQTGSAMAMLTVAYQ